MQNRERAHRMRTGGGRFLPTAAGMALLWVSAAQSYSPRGTATASGAPSRPAARALPKGQVPGGTPAAFRAIAFPNLPSLPAADFTRLPAPVPDVAWRPGRGTPAFVEGRRLRAPDPAGLSGFAAAPGAAAMAYFQSNRELFRLRNPESELRFQRENTDRFRSRHEIFQQYLDGVPVWGGQINAHFDSAGTLYAVNACYPPTPALPSGGWSLDAAGAIGRALSDLAQVRGPVADLPPETRALLDYTGPSADREIWVDPETGAPHRAWRVEIRPSLIEWWRYFLDAGTGGILEKYDATNADGPKTASAKDLFGANQTINTYQVGSTYYLIDGTRQSFDSRSGLPNSPKGALVTMTAGNTDLVRVSQITSGNNTWNDASSVSAHYNMAKVYEYYLGNLGRNAIDGNGGTMIAAVHVTMNGQAMDNAYFNGRLMAYGDGNRVFKPLARALDVTAHEMTHGVIAATVNLGPTGQSGALNESLADVFGCMIDRDDWRMGEDVVNSGSYPSGALRDLADPHNGGRSQADPSWQPAHMMEYVKASLNNDNGGVHINNGVPNHAAYLIAQAIGREKTEKIYYRVLEARYLNSFSQFMDMRLGAVRAAADLYGADSPEVAAVRDGFTAVGIGTAESDDKPKPRPPDRTPADGVEYVAYIDAKAGDSSLYMAKAVVKGDSDITHLSSTQVFTGSGRPIAVSGDGSVFLFIDSKNNLRIIDAAGERVAGTPGAYKSVAVSPDGSTAALTTVQADAKIHLLDLAHPGQERAISLYTPAAGQSVQANTVVYADAIEFDATGKSLVYDCLNSVPQAQGNPIEFWDADMVDIESGVITPVLPTLPDGVSIGNPSFAKTSDLNVVFDLIDEFSGTFSVVAADLFTGSFRTLDSGAVVPGSPRYSTRDDKVVFTHAAGNALNVFQLSLQQDKLTPTGRAASYMANAQKPVWFVKRPRSTGVPGTAAGKPAAFGLSAEAGGALRLDLPEDAAVVVEAFDSRGRSLGAVARGRYAAGSHRLAWTAPAGTGICWMRTSVRPDSGPARTLVRKMVF